MKSLSPLAGRTVVSFLCLQSSELVGVVALLLLSSECYVAVIVSCLFLAMPCFGLQCVIVALPGHSRLLVTST